MERMTCLLRVNESDPNDFHQAILERLSMYHDRLLVSNCRNLSIWAIDNLLFMYSEIPDPALRQQCGQFLELIAGHGLSNDFTWCARPGQMKLMYSRIGIVREDKGLVKRHVFMTKLKPGFRDEYKARHDRLADSQPAADDSDVASNFTIWNAGDYICGYNEMVVANIHEPSHDEKQNTIKWEKNMLNIMDWLTDDVDWLTGEHHDPVKRLF